jgi:cytochrome c-type biogenesis protein CcmH/NrfG
VSYARAALRWQPYSPQPWLVLGDVTHDADAYRHATQLDPEDWLLWQRLAGVEHGQARRLAEARAAHLNPFGGR